MTAPEPIDGPGPMGRRMRWAVAGVVGLALVLRLVLIFGWMAETPLAGDANWYSGSAVVLSQGHWFLNPESPPEDNVPDADHPPATTFVLAISPLVLGLEGEAYGLPTFVLGQRVTLAFVGAAAAWVAMLATRRLVRPTRWGDHADAAALAAGLIIAVHPNLMINDATLYSESLGAVVAGWVILAATRAWDRPKWTRWAVLGIAIGVATLVRPEQLVLGPLLVVPLAFARYRAFVPAARSVVAAALAVVAALAPWVGPNLVRFEEPVLLSTNDGPTILGTYCPDAIGGRLDGSWAMQCLRYVDGDGNGVDDWTDFTSGFDPFAAAAADPDGATESGKPPVEDASSLSRVYSDYGIEYAKAHAGEIPRVMYIRVGRQWGFVNIGENINLDYFDARPRTVSWAAWAFGWLLFPVAWVGIVLLRRAGRPWWVLAVNFVVVTLFAAVFYGRARFKIPWDVSSAIASGVVVAALIERYANRRRSEVPGPE